MNGEIEIRRYHSTFDKTEQVILTATGDPCYGENCCGCCGLVTLYLPVGDAIALRDRLDTVINETQRAQA